MISSMSNQVAELKMILSTSSRLSSTFRPIARVDVASSNSDTSSTDSDSHIQRLLQMQQLCLTPSLILFHMDQFPLFIWETGERGDFAIGIVVGTSTPLVSCTTYTFVDTQFVQDRVDQSAYGKTTRYSQFKP
ncbi:myosin-11 isoform X2 [Senna tora]|uniref:Myosin-11 isoform X2 n=1 Tax=Senna tora TaxID=362788 RepID=A0A834SPF7_9FABA|nr:myosin-11 isoform X2 [Senna tora]